jgi:hypothetical protein
MTRGDHFRFSSVFTKKVTKLVFFLNRNRFKSNGFDSVILEQKSVQIDRFRFTSVWLDCFLYFLFFLFSFFGFRLIKPKPNRLIFF